MKAMKKVLLLMLGFATPFLAEAQEGGMARWSFSSKKITADIFEVTAKALIERGWHIYSQKSGEGSSPTVFGFTENPLVKLDGKVIEQGKLIKKKNDVLDSEIRYYADSVTFVQRVIVKPLSPQGGSLLKKERIVLKGTVEFMVCNQNMCLPPEEIPFAIKLN